MLQRLWNRSSGEVSAEAGMFIGDRAVNLLFPAKRITRVFCPALGETYESGRDFTHEPGGSRIRLAAGSRIPRIPESALHPDPANARTYPEHGTKGSNAIEGGPGGSLLVFDNWDWFAKHQVEIDYVAEDIDFPMRRCLHPERLPRLRSMLAAGARPKITFVGDSITEGFNASLYVGIPPMQPQYAGLVAAELNAAVARNRGVNGSGAADAAQHPENWADDRPDLLVIAYGMNDFFSDDIDTYLENIAKIIEIAKERRPDTETLLVASMSGKEDWKWTPPGSAKRFAAALGKFAMECDMSCGFVDQCAVWSKLLERKDFFDLTGNGVNHPNDYGHRVLASNILAELRESEAYF